MNKGNVLRTEIRSTVVKINQVQRDKISNYIVRKEKLIGSTMSSRPTKKNEITARPPTFNFVMALKKKNIENLIQ